MVIGQRPRPESSRTRHHRCATRSPASRSRPYLRRRRSGCWGAVGGCRDQMQRRQRRSRPAVAGRRNGQARSTIPTRCRYRPRPERPTMPLRCPRGNRLRVGGHRDRVPLGAPAGDRATRGAHPFGSAHVDDTIAKDATRREFGRFQSLTCQRLHRIAPQALETKPHTDESGRAAVRSGCDRRRSVSRMGASLMLAYRRAMSPRSSNSHISLP